MKAAAGILVLIGLGLVAGAQAATPKARPLPSCHAFMDSYDRAVAPRRASFERPLTITRGFFGDEPGIEIRTLSTDDEVEGTLKCRGDEFRRFEVRVTAPFSEKQSAALRSHEEAGLVAAFGWDKAKVTAVVNAMTSDAAEYLKASVQRGDIYVSGKVEYHQGDALDLGVLWTDADKTFVVTSQTDE